MTSINSLNLVKSKTYYKKKFFLSWCSFSDRLISNKDICVSRWAEFGRLLQIQKLSYIRDERLDILETFKEKHETLLEAYRDSRSAAISNLSSTSSNVSTTDQEAFEMFSRNASLLWFLKLLVVI